MRSALLQILAGLFLLCGPAYAEDTTAKPPSVDECKDVSGEGPYSECVAALVTRADGLVSAVTESLAGRADDYSDMAAERFTAAVGELAIAAKKRDETFCEVTTYESRNGSGYASILASCLLEERLAYLKKIEDVIRFP